jgi:hypothetical protein
VAEQRASERAAGGDECPVQYRGGVADLNGFHRAVREPHGGRAAHADQAGGRRTGRIRLAQPCGDPGDTVVQTPETVRALQFVSFVGAVAHLRVGVPQGRRDRRPLGAQVGEFLFEGAPGGLADRCGFAGRACSSGAEEIEPNWSIFTIFIGIDESMGRIATICDVWNRGPSEPRTLLGVLRVREVPMSSKRRRKKKSRRKHAANHGRRPQS